MYLIYHIFPLMTEGDLFNAKYISSFVISVKDPTTGQLPYLLGGYGEDRVHLKLLVYLAEVQMSRLHPRSTETECVLSVLGIALHKLLWVSDCVLLSILFPVPHTNSCNRVDTQYVFAKFNHSTNI